MKRFIIFLIVFMLFSFSGCGRKAEIFNPNKPIIESDSEIIIESNSEISSVPEKEPEPQTNFSENKYSITEICPHIDIGHDGGTLFSGGKLYISATVHRDESSCDEKLIIDLETGKEEASYGLYLLYDVDCFTDDFYRNVYHLISEYGSDIEGDYVYSLISLNESGNSGDSINLHLGDDFGISDITCDINGNWYLGNCDGIRIYNGAFEEIFRFENQNIYSMPSILRLPDGRVAAIFDENGFEIRIFDPETFEFSECCQLSLTPNSLYSGNSEYNVIFIVLDESYQNLLYGLDFGKEPEFIINLNEYIEEDFTVLNANIDESGNIFTILGTEKLRYGATEIYKFEPKK